MYRRLFRNNTVMTLHKALAIINPKAGRHGSEKDVARELQKQCTPLGIDLAIRMVEKEDDARTWAASAGADGCDVVIVAGGDGTINETVVGLRSGGNLPIAIIPTGSANLLAMELGIPANVPKAVAIALKGEIQHIDLAYCASHKRYLLNAAAIGYASKVFEDAKQHYKNVFGFPAYLFAGFKNIFSVKAHRFFCTIDDREEPIKAQMVVIANNNLAGLRLVNLGPKVLYNDGKLDLIAFDHKNAVAIARLMADMMLNPTTPKPQLRYFQARTIEVRTKFQQPITIDGEVFRGKYFQATILPGGLSVVVPAAAT